MVKRMSDGTEHVRSYMNLGDPTRQNSDDTAVITYTLDQGVCRPLSVREVGALTPPRAELW